MTAFSARRRLDQDHLEMVSEAEVRRMLKAHCKEMGGQRAVARSLNVSPQFINMVLHGNKPPSGPLLDHFGLERVEYIRRKEK